MVRAPQSVDVGQLISRLGDFEKKIGRDLADTTKEIAAAETRLRNFKKLSQDKQFGNWYSHYQRAAHKELRNAKKRKDRIGTRLEEVRALLQHATDLAGRTHDVEAGERQRSRIRSFNQRRSQ